jgi:hypothetical protein
MTTREDRAQDVLMGLWPAISLKVPLHFGHWMMCDARRISSFGRPDVNLGGQRRVQRDACLSPFPE